MRISITDRCNFRCQYCMPNGIKWVEHEKIMSYEEILTICKIAVEKGIVNFKVTGGEPLVRAGCLGFLRKLKQMEGVQTVTITTNGYYLAEVAEELAEIGIDGVNVSLDVLDAERFDQITGIKGGKDRVLEGIRKCMALGLKTKINAVLLKETEDQIIPLASLAKDNKIDIKFIEIMPVGYGRKTPGVSAKEALERLRTEWPDLKVATKVRGNGPAIYYESRDLIGKIGLIHAVSNPFCEDCNRVRLTSQGVLKPCLCYEAGVNLGAILRSGEGVDALRKAFDRAITEKPEAHCFSHLEKMTEHKGMSEIGG